MTKTTTPANTSAESLLGRAADEFTQRLNTGEDPDIEEYAARHPQIADAIRQVFPALRALRPAAPGNETLAQQTAGAVDRRLGDYRIIREIGRGGMGIVYDAEQISLGRRVALKVLPFAAVLDERQLQRFKNEAHAAAQLHHTNIVPVFSVGCERGVHYYAMQFIDGQTLAQVIAELSLAEPRSAAPPRATSAANSGSAAPPRTTSDTVDSAAARLPESPRAANGSSAALDAFAPGRSHRTADFFRSVANLGVQAAEALEHAHEFGIVHRDIKPSNLLLDERGNLWITDFGLARLESSPDLTMTGDILGTLRYMSPEQAAGKNLLLDHRTDIYSLGVTLYELLTLKPAIDGRDRPELLRKIADHDPRPPRRLNPAIPADLETIVLKATAKEPHRRYASAKELARDLDRFLEDKPIRARRPTLAERAAKWSRRHRHLVASAAVMLLLAVVGLSISTALIWREQSRTAGALADVEDQRAKAEKEKALAEAIAGLVYEMLDSAAPHEVKGRNYTVRQLLDEFAAGLRDQLKDQPEVEAGIRTTIGRAYRGLGEKDKAEQHLGAALKIRQTIYGHDHELVADSLYQWAWVLHDRGDYGDAEQTSRDALALQRRFRGNEHPSVATSLSLIADMLKHRGAYAESEEVFREVLDVQRRLLGDDHPNTLTSIHNMARLLESRKKFAEAEVYIREGLESSRRVRGDDHPQTLSLMYRMGLLLLSMEKHAEAGPYIREALEGRRRLLGDDHPRTLHSMISMGTQIRWMGRLAEAEPYLREALERTRRTLGKDHPLTLSSMCNLGSLLMVMDKLAEAEAYNREALEICRRTLGDDDQTTLIAIGSMAYVLRSMGKYAEAEPYNREQLELCRRVLGDDHASTLRAISGVGFLLKSMGKYREAEPYLREALESQRRVLGDDHRSTLISIKNMAELLTAMGKPAEAEPLFVEAVEGATRTLPKGNWLMGVSLASYGKCLTKLSRYADAERALLEAVEILETALGAKHTRTRKAIKFLADLYDAWDKPEQAAEQRARLEAIAVDAATQQSESKEND